MAKVGIYRIGFASQTEMDDQWVLEDQDNRGSGTSYNWFASIDQKQASLTERLVTDENGMCFETTLNFSVRKDTDMALAKKWMRLPVILFVEAVDQKTYTLGTKQYPVWMQTENTYEGIDTREINIEVVYRSLNGLLNK